MSVLLCTAVTKHTNLNLCAFENFMVLQVKITLAVNKIQGDLVMLLEKEETLGKILLGAVVTM